MPSEKKQNNILEGIPIGLITFRNVSIIVKSNAENVNFVGGLSSLPSCDQGTYASTVI